MINAFHNIRKIYLVVFLLPGFSAFAQQDNRITIGFTDTVYSKILNEKRRILVHIPNNDRTKHYPVLYILDGDDHFQSAVAIDEQLSGPLPEMIIIGITNTDRERDLTPTHIQPDRMVNAGDAARSGGGENFLAFIEKELMPYVDSHYPTTKYRVFSGHSLGGLTVMNAFFNHTELFNSYIAIDPSLWWNGRKWIESQKAIMKKKNFNNKGLFVAIANNLPPGMDTLSVMKDTSIGTSFSRSVLGFVQSLRNAQPAGLRWSSKYYPNEWHGVVELNAEYDALRNLFAFYRFDMGRLRQNPDLNGDSLLTEHYQKVSDILGYKMVPGESNVNDLAYFYMSAGRMKQAYALFKRNVEMYPQSANAFDSLGEYYESAGDKKNAIAAYTKSLSLQETEDTRRKLNKLTK